MIRVSHLDITHQGSLLIHDLSATFAQGSLTLILGASGAGKSTLLRTLAGLHRPANGERTYDEQTLSMDTDPSEELQRRIAYCGPDATTEWFAPRVLDEYRFVLGRRQKNDVRRAGRANRVWRLPRGSLLRSPFSLSDGEQRRLLLALSLLEPARFILLDDPLVSLDEASRERVVSHMVRLKEQGAAVLVSAAEEGTWWRYADQALILRTGQKPLAVSPDQLLRDRGLWCTAQLTPGPEIALALRAHERGQCVARATWTTEEAIRAWYEAAVELSESPLHGGGNVDVVPDNARTEPLNPLRNSTHQIINDPLTDQPTGTEPLKFTELAVEEKAGGGISSLSKQESDPRLALAWGVLGSAGLLVQSGGIGDLVAGLSVCTVFVVHRSTAAARGRAASARQTMRRITAVFFGVLLLSAFAGLRFHAAWPWAGFTLTSSLSTLRALTIIACAALWSMLWIRDLSFLQTFISLRAVGWHLTRNRRLADRLGISAALVLRFTVRLSTVITRVLRNSRLRRRLPPQGRLGLGEVRALVVPTLVEAVRMADALADTLILRGFRFGEWAPESLPVFRRRDRCLTVLAVVWLILLLLASRLGG